MEMKTLLITLILAFVLGVIFTRIVIPTMKKLQFQQFQREEGPKSHMHKQGTPSMGGIGILLACIIACAIAGGLSLNVLITILCTLAFALVGFLDDYAKAVKKQNEGLNPKQKIIFQFVFALAFAIYMGLSLGTEVWIPFYGQEVDFGIMYYPFIVFVLLAMTNSVNLTDGMDGLASGVTFFVALFFVYTANTFAFPDEGIYAMALAGACLGFLVFNHYPAKIFMGDTGSMGLGAALSAVAIAMKAELLLPIVGLIYVLEACSVIIQVAYFKKTGGKRFFRMAPLHHHFEEGGMKETKVVLMFWAFAILCCLIGVGVINI
ncbi:MAG: phospho-N-acetylmuramoyl-pentapeptide-transferase [Clostridia bacterium]|nr:phospho-N-acetylmuramoyl-pentapeptide-transferase [Clostridia bacterium]